MKFAEQALKRVSLPYLESDLPRPAAAAGGDRLHGALPTAFGVFFVKVGCPFLWVSL